MPKIFISREILERGVDLLRDKGYEIEVGGEEMLTRDGLLEKAKGADAVLTMLTDAIDAEALDAIGPQLQVVSNYAVGFDNVDLEECKKRGIAVTNTPGVLSHSVAEHTVALLLAVSKRIVEGDQYVRAGKYHGWGPKLFLGADFYEKTLGIVGLGRIGHKVGKILHDGFGVNVIYSDLKDDENFNSEVGAVRKDLDDVLKEADFVSIHVPLLDSTHHLINAERLGLMKETAYLVNTSRGPVIDEVALVNALKNKQIAGAGLDVFENEPSLTAGLAELENVVLTPHIASASIETRQQMSEIAAKNIIAVLEGSEPVSQVA